ncbi:replication initiator protein [Dipodfec virus RodF1_38]|uniref:Replication initiator protein n=1 Tax=Dipodfec virus RodF1_38 TaxID=2929296 RepID=A0A976N332_9VIRU|nr:replication initiator protein [Dipodfec virus RodF1_38]
MACLHPIAIKNRRYATHAEDYNLSQQYLHPFDIAKKVLLVPCGKCPECIRQMRNDWKIRLSLELTHQRKMHRSSYFVTITFSPEYYERALKDPTKVFRAMMETYRHKFKTSIKHAFFQEFGTQGTRRLHFHGLLFGCPFRISEIREVFSAFGYCWIRPVRPADAGYTSKYVCKQPTDDPRYANPAYRRKFVSPSVGRDLCGFPPPSATRYTWSFNAPSIGVSFHHRIPRYYDVHLTESDLLFRAAQSAYRLVVTGVSPVPLLVIEKIMAEYLSDEQIACIHNRYGSEYIRKYHRDTALLNQQRSQVSKGLGSFHPYKYGHIDPDV